MRRVLAALAVVVAGIATASPAAAITNGTADGNRHPNVGGLSRPRRTPTARGSTAPRP